MRSRQSVTRSRDQFNDPISLSVVVPALNEEDNLEEAVAGMITALQAADVDWEIVLINDGSTDRTPDIARELAGRDAAHIKVLHHEQPMGIGYSFRDGVRASGKWAVTWMPGDGENDPAELLKYVPLLKHVDIIIPFVINTGVRGLGRRILSTLYLSIVNLTFGTTFNYTNGTVIYRQEVFKLVEPRANGFFFQTECLIKAIRAGFIFAEVPVYLEKRRGGHSKAVSLKSLYAVTRDFLMLFFAIHVRRTVGQWPERLRLPPKERRRHPPTSG